MGRELTFWGPAKWGARDVVSIRHLLRKESQIARTADSGICGPGLGPWYSNRSMWKEDNAGRNRKNSICTGQRVLALLLGQLYEFRALACSTVPLLLSTIQRVFPPVAAGPGRRVPCHVRGGERERVAT